MSVALPLRAATPTFGPGGLVGLKEGALTLEIGPGPRFTNGSTRQGTQLSNKIVGSKFDGGTRTQSTQYEWGSVAAVYTPEPGGVGIRITITNTGEQTLDGLTLHLHTLSGLEPVRQRGNPAYAVHDPGFTFVHGTAGSVVLGTPETGKPLTLDLGEDKKTGAVVAKVVIGGDRILADNITANRPIAPGASETIAVTLRVAPAPAELGVLARDLIESFRKTHPMKLEWPDRRPILRCFFGGGISKEESVANLKNPDRIVPPEPDPKFGEQLFAKLRGVIEAAKAADAQGVVLWDLEGGTFPHAITYIGDPRLIRALNPQMDLVIDDGVKLLREAGLNVGITLRPSRVIANEAGDNAKHSHTVANDPFEELDAKVAYARDRWECRLFYVDTNVFWRSYAATGEFKSAPLAPDVWQRLQAKYPDTLFIPEFAGIGDYPSVAGYGEADMGNYGVPEVARLVWPKAFRVIVIEDADAGEQHDRFVRAVREGNVLMTFGQGAKHFNVVSIGRFREEARLLDAGPPDAVRRSSPGQLPSFLGSPDPVVRFHALNRLASEPVPASGGRILALAQDATQPWFVRKAAVAALGTHPGSGVTEFLLGLADDKPLGLYGIAAKSLAAQGDKVGDEVVARMEALLKSGKTTPQALDALGSALVKQKATGKAAAVQELYPLTAPLKNAQNFQAKLIELVGLLRNPESEAFLLPLLDEEKLAPVAAAALVRIGSKTGVDEVKKRMAAAKAAGNKERAGAFGRALAVK